MLHILCFALLVACTVFDCVLKLCWYYVLMVCHSVFASVWFVFMMFLMFNSCSAHCIRNYSWCSSGFQVFTMLSKSCCFLFLVSSNVLVWFWMVSRLCSHYVGIVFQPCCNHLSGIVPVFSFRSLDELMWLSCSCLGVVMDVHFVFRFPICFLNCSQ